jgi:hypothetical protein
VIKLENGQHLNMRKRLTRFEWAEIRTAYASGIGLRELGTQFRDSDMGTT